MGLLKRDKPRASLERVRRSQTHDLLEYSGTTLNTIGRALEVYRSGDPFALTLALDEATLLREMLVEVSARSD
jgi:hypothetical protein